MSNPWRTPSSWSSTGFSQYIDAETRIGRIKTSSDVAWLRSVLAWPDNQVSVRVAAERRLRKLAKGAGR